MSQFTDIINEKKPTLVDFYATWCGPCKMQGPIIEEVKAAVGDEANVLKIDVDRNPELAAQYRIQCPRLLFSAVARLCGARLVCIRRLTW